MRLVLCLAVFLLVGCSKPQEKIIPLDKAKWDGEPCALPVAWRGIKFPLLELIREIAYSVYCAGCRKEFRPDEVLREEVNYHESIKCPNGHRLFSVQTLHVIN